MTDEQFKKGNELRNAAALLMDGRRIWRDAYNFAGLYVRLVDELGSSYTAIAPPDFVQFDAVREAVLDVYDKKIDFLEREFNAL